MLLRGPSGEEVRGVVSIHGQREHGVDAKVGIRLDLAFDDVDVVDPGDLVAMQRALSLKRRREQDGLVEVAPTSEDAFAIIGFAERVRGLRGAMLCHCGAGISRAPAAALISLAVWNGPGTEAACVREVRRLRRGAMPHIGLIRFFDELLKRRGALLEALRIPENLEDLPSPHS